MYYCDDEFFCEKGRKLYKWYYDLGYVVFGFLFLLGDCWDIFLEL